jgi:large subunit ribosomal protein L13Ae
MKRMVVPQALAVTRIKPQRHVTLLGRLSSEVGWKYWDLVKELEEKRKVNAKVFYARKKSLAKASAAEAKKCAPQK